MVGLWLNRDRAAARQAAIVARGIAAAEGRGLDEQWFDALCDTPEEAKLAMNQHRANQREAELARQYRRKP